MTDNSKGYWKENIKNFIPKLMQKADHQDMYFVMSLSSADEHHSAAPVIYQLI